MLGLYILLQKRRYATDQSTGPRSVLRGLYVPFPMPNLCGARGGGLMVRNGKGGHVMVRN